MPRGDRSAGRYQRHRPEQTLLYRIIEQHYPVFCTHLAELGRGLPEYVQREFEGYLKCDRLEHGFLRVRCDTCHVEHLVAFSCKRRGVNMHHMLFLDGVYIDGGKFRWVKAPTTQELTQLAHTIASRTGRFLERDAENSYLASDAVDEDPMTQLLGHSITYRIAVGPQQGRKIFTG